MDESKHNRICEAYWDIWNRTQSDPEYARLRTDMEELERQYEAIVQTLPEPHREIIDHYITHRESMSRRMLEFACTTITP